MIKYDAGTYGLAFILRIKGSVFPKAMLWAVPNAIVGLLLHLFARQEQIHGNQMSMTGVNMLWAGYSSVLGFLVVFRNNQAYTRFWEGATLINQVRGEWFNAVSTLFAFCDHTEAKREDVNHFQHTLIRLASMLYCSALQQVCVLDDDDLEIIDVGGMDPASLAFMSSTNDRCEVLLQWIQRLIVDADEEKTIKIAPPLLTRAFQELSRGIVNLNNARKIKDIPFPFPYAQMITCMFIVHWFTTPIMASQVMESGVAVVAVCFFVTFAFWCLIYIALEIDQPFGDDENDLPLRDMQKDFNQSLMNLLHPLAQNTPTWKPLDGEDTDTQVLKFASMGCETLEHLRLVVEDAKRDGEKGLQKPPEPPITRGSKLTKQGSRNTADSGGSGSENMKWGRLRGSSASRSTQHPFGVGSMPSADPRTSSLRSSRVVSAQSMASAPGVVANDSADAHVAGAVNVRVPSPAKFGVGVVHVSSCSPSSSKESSDEPAAGIYTSRSATTPPLGQALKEHTNGHRREARGPVETYCF